MKVARILICYTNTVPQTMALILFLLSLLCCGAWCGSTDQSLVDYISTNLQIRYDVVSNFDRKCRISLHNSGSQNIPAGQWEVYFSHIRPISSLSWQNDSRYEWIPAGSFQIRHVNGVLYKMRPAQNFTSLPSGGRQELYFRPQGMIVSKTDLMPNWYVVAPSCEARTILSTAGESLSFVGPFDTPEKWKRYRADQYDPLTPEQRYDHNHMVDLGRAPKTVIPTPVRESFNSQAPKAHLGSGDWVIVAPQQLTNEANFIKGETEMPIVRTAPRGRYVQLTFTADLPVHARREGYKLQVNGAEQKVVISANSSTGIFYGVQTLRALYASNKSIPTGDITDWPRFPWRGMHYDNSRNQQGKSHVFRFLDAMSMYKLNRLHWHITDDEAWRLEIEGLPDLTQLGGYRCHSLDEKRCLIPQLGSGPSTGTSGSGFFTKEDYRNLLRYANKRHITIVPEFDCPGHARAAVIAMKARYERLKAQNASNAGRYNLHDPNDTSRYHSVQNFHDNAINPCVESTFTFFRTLMEKVKSLHEGIQPLKIFHFGGDEVAANAWSESPACDRLGQRLGKNLSHDDIKDYFVMGISNISASLDLDLAGWEDGFLNKNDVPINVSYLANQNAYANPWNNIWEQHKGQRAYVLANAGYKVILSHATNFYFDMPYEPDPDERGYYWATRYTDEQQVFGYMPDNVYENIELANNGSRITKQGVCGSNNENCPPLLRRENIIGMQGQLWSETVRTQDQFEYMVFPRLVALAERAWHKADWETQNQTRDANRQKDWGDFVNTLGHRELRRLDRIGVHYRVPPPGVRLHNKRLSAASTYPGLKIQFSTDGGRSWSDYLKSFVPVPDTQYTFLTRSADRSRTSRRINFKTPPAPATTPTSASSKLACMFSPPFMVVLLLVWKAS